MVSHLWMIRLSFLLAITYIVLVLATVFNLTLRRDSIEWFSSKVLILLSCHNFISSDSYQSLFICVGFFSKVFWINVHWKLIDNYYPGKNHLVVATGCYHNLFTEHNCSYLFVGVALVVLFILPMLSSMGMIEEKPCRRKKGKLEIKWHLIFKRKKIKIKGV